MKLKSNILLLFTFVWCFATNSFSQIYNFKNYTLENGLPQSYVQTILQDNKGYIWLGTSDGLVKYDGVHFRVFTKRDGLQENAISSLHKYSNGNILIGHQGGGLSIMRNDSVKPFYLGESVTINNRVQSIYTDSQKNTWIGTIGSGLYKISENKTEHFSDVKYGIGNSVFCIIEDSEKTLWIATENGTYLLKPNTSDFEKLNLPEHSAYYLLKDKKQNIWIGTNRHGLFIVPEKHNNKPQEITAPKFKILNKENGLSHTTIFTIEEDTKGNIWAGAYNNGVCKISFNKKTNEYDIKNFGTENGLPNDVVYKIIEDREGNIWLGTLGGACVIKPDLEKFELYNTTNNLLNNKQVWSIEKQNNVLWVGTELGLNRIELSKNGKPYKSKPYISLENGLKDDHIMSLLNEPGKGIWCGTRQGLAFLPENSNRFTLYDITSKFTTSIVRDSENNLWIGAWDGAYKYNTFTKEKKKYSTENILKNNVVNKIIIDSKNNKWIATEGGLTKLSPDEKSITYNKLTGLKSDNIYCVTEDLEGNIWLGTQEAGVYKYDGTSFKNYNSSNGFSSDNIYSIIADNNNNIWIGTSSGIDKFDTKNNTVTHYGKTEGFLGIETNLNAVHKDKDGNLWFGTVNGLMKYNATYDIKNTVEPLTYIIGAKIFLKDTLDLNEHKISYKQNHLSFSFIGLSFSNSENVRYQFMLEGFDEEWSPVTNKTEVTYSNIPHGNYIFKVKSCNNDGVWNETPATYSFAITPPFWKTIWFIITCIVAVLIIIYLYISIRTRKLEKAKQLLETQVKERTAEVVHQKQEIEQKNKDITDSINYARRIQFALLPVKQEIQKKFSDSFVFYKPRDIVSGDLYWFSEINNKTLIAVVDCTGHGVPGAFMSIVANSSLNEIVNEKGITEPDKILSALDEKVTQTLKQSSEESETRDGMDVALCSFDKDNKTMEYAGANRPLVMVRKGEFTKIKGSNFPVGSYHDNTKNFAKHTLQLEKNDSIYLFSDGYADQFGGPKGKKFMTKKFEDLLMQIQNINMSKQEEELKNALSHWQGGLESVDDILVIGLKI